MTSLPQRSPAFTQWFRNVCVFVWGVKRRHAVATATPTLKIYGSISTFLPGRESRIDYKSPSHSHIHQTHNFHTFHTSLSSERIRLQHQRKDLYNLCGSTHFKLFNTFHSGWFALKRSCILQIPKSVLTLGFNTNQNNLCFDSPTHDFTGAHRKQTRMLYRSLFILEMRHTFKSIQSWVSIHSGLKICSHEGLTRFLSRAESSLVKVENLTKAVPRSGLSRLMKLLPNLSKAWAYVSSFWIWSDKRAQTSTHEQISFAHHSCIYVMKNAVK